MSAEERSEVEYSFKTNLTDIIVSTPTLAQGINLPAKNVVIFDLQRWNAFKSSNEFLEDYEFLQMRGRAGRPREPGLVQGRPAGARHADGD